MGIKENSAQTTWYSEMESLDIQYGQGFFISYPRSEVV